MGSIVLAILAGGLVVGVVAWLAHQRSAKAAAQALADAKGRIATLSAELAQQAALVEQGGRDVQALEATVAQPSKPKRPSSCAPN
jgi:hypothetical protein